MKLVTVQPPYKKDIIFLLLILGELVDDKSPPPVRSAKTLFHHMVNGLSVAELLVAALYKVLSSTFIM